ncbi:hypothetical protein [Amycolatopsis sp. cmx-11-51]|uniref:hypothetical protein n=1 Tax=unclassified Amycolatopsis TaxID=2618356 RepID=UPI0039E3B156
MTGPEAGLSSLTVWFRDVIEEKADRVVFVCEAGGGVKAPLATSDATKDAFGPDQGTGS